MKNQQEPEQLHICAKNIAIETADDGAHLFQKLDAYLI
jgi:hypothetical protein